MEYQLTADQVIILGSAVSALAFIVRLIVSKGGIALSREVISVVIYILSWILAALFAGLALPEPTFAGWVDFLAIQLGPLAGFAFAIYNLILKALFEKIGDIVPVMKLPTS